MDFTAALGLDIAAAAIVIYCMVSAARKGFLRTIVQMAAYVAIVMAASFLSRAAAPVIYDRIVEPMIFESSRSEDAPQSKQNAALVSAVPHGLLSLLDEALDPLTDLLPENLDPQEFADDLIDDLTDATLRPLMISAISMIGFVAVFAILSLLANILLSALGIINYVPVVGTFNALLGGAVGILQGVLIVWVLAVLLGGLLHIYPEGWWIFNQNVIGKTFLFQYFMNPALLSRFGA